MPPKSRQPNAWEVFSGMARSAAAPHTQISTSDTADLKRRCEAKAKAISENHYMKKTATCASLHTCSIMICAYVCVICHENGLNSLRCVYRTRVLLLSSVSCSPCT